MKKLFIALSVLFISCKNVTHTGVIIDKVYTPSSTGTGLSTKGSMVMVYNSEKYTLVYKDKAGEITTEEVDKGVYYTVKIGDTATYTTLEGNF